MIAYVYTMGDYGMNTRNFGILRKFIHTLLSTVQIKQVENGPRLEGSIS